MTSPSYQEIVQAAWKAVENKGLDSNIAYQISEQTGISVLEIQSIIPQSLNLLLLLTADILDKIRPLSHAGLSAHDYLFDMVMQGFDYAEPHKKAIKKLWEDVRWQPWLGGQIIPVFQKKLNEITAEVFSSSFLLKKITEWGFHLVCFNVFLTWLEDETLDLSKTMASLDVSLKHYFDIYKYLQ